MNTPASMLDAQVDSLLQVINDYRERLCKERLEKAQTQATDLLAEARRSARNRVHKAAEQERAHACQQVAATQAQLQTQHRQREQSITLELLERGSKRLSEALQRRWVDPQARRWWIKGTLTQACAALPATPWHIEHPADLDTTELNAWIDEITTCSGQAPIMAADPSIAAGLRICYEGACVDATVDGLLADREWVASHLLALINA